MAVYLLYTAKQKDKFRLLNLKNLYFYNCKLIFFFEIQKVLEETFGVFWFQFIYSLNYLQNRWYILFNKKYFV